eukprot:4458449-Prymnesium_polylepis.1
MMKAMGWVPERDFSMDRLITRFLPPALFFFNLYYYMGLSTALQFVDCKDSDEGFQYVSDFPYLRCYEGKHGGYVVAAWIGMIFYMVGVPIWYLYVFFKLIPSRGYDDATTVQRYGFLYRRFEQRFVYWELVEMFRKFLFIVVRLIRVDALIQSFCALVSVSLVLGLELYYHPFRSKLYDYLEEYTSFVEFMVLLLGLVLSANPDPKGWIEPLAWVFIIIAFILIIFAFFVDIRGNIQQGQFRALREKANVILSPALFHLQYGHHLL